MSLTPSAAPSVPQDRIALSRRLYELADTINARGADALRARIELRALLAMFRDDIPRQ
ncbi:hypothetical protein [Paenirhodobacter sp.]|jgi:hypothetical protein|uniref:hypothetical protein n=1 Tax=Paenirhodobacter sp. TaxID=1965326 RepID=UPI003B5118E4